VNHYNDSWSIDETDYTIEGYTSMDNFDMYSYMEKFVGVDMDKVQWK